MFTPSTLACNILFTPAQPLVLVYPLNNPGFSLRYLPLYTTVKEEPEQIQCNKFYSELNLFYLEGEIVD